MISFIHVYLVGLLVGSLMSAVVSNTAAAAANHHVHVKIEELRDWKLCNNGLKPNHFYGNPDKRCYHRGKYEPCDDRQYNATTCRQGTLDLLGHNHKEYLHKIRALFEVADHDLSLRRLTLHYRRDMYQAISHVIDSLMTPRPWWTIEQETFPWHLQDQMLLVIERMESRREYFLRWVADVHYPDESICNQTPMWLGAQLGIHPGIATGLSFYNNFYRYSRFMRTLIYVSISNDPKDDAEFATGLACPNTLNKWECVFYPTSNCSLPDILSLCGHYGCVQELQMSVISNSSSNAVLFKRETEIYKNVTEYYALHSFSKKNEEMYKHWIDLKVRYKYMVPYIFNNSAWFIDYQDEAYDLFLLMDFYTRPNAYFRSLIDLSLHEMEKKFQIRMQDFGHNDSCVAAHVRRGDRIPKETNITKYCLEHPGDFEKACGSNAEFAKLRLDHILKHAERMVDSSVRTLIVATDDMAYLKGEIQRVEREGTTWKIAYVPWIGPEDVDITPGLSDAEKEARYHKMRHSGGSLSGAQYFASMKALQKCEAFVGHFASAVSHMIYHIMCERHSAYEGQCAPTYNLANGYDVKK